MFKKIALYSFIFISSLSSATAATPSVTLEAAEKYIQIIEDNYLKDHSFTLAQMLDFFSDETGNHAAETMISIYNEAIKEDNDYNLHDAFFSLCHLANAIAEDNMARRPETRTDLGRFVEDNNKLIQSYEALFN